MKRKAVAVAGTKVTKSRKTKRTLKRLCLRPSEVAKLVGADKSTIHRLIDRGVLRAVQPGGPKTSTYIPVEEVERLFGAEIVEAVEVRS